MKKLLALLALLVGAVVASVPAAEQVVISEFMAANSHTLADEDGNYEDWIEIMNVGSTTVNLLNWSLTDNAGNLTKWRFPSVTIAPNATMVIFASNKDRRTPGQQLHTNFRLNNDGEFLALVRGDGSIASQFSPVFPRQADDVSYGMAVEQTPVPLISNGSPARVHVPASDALGATWTQNGFNDAAWRNATNGLGFQLVAPPVTPSAVLADSVAEFSGTQGQNNWYYGFWNKSADADGVYAATEFAPLPWGGGSWVHGGFPPWTELWNNGGHPNFAPAVHYTVRRWVSEVEGLVRLVGYLSDGGECGDGQDLKIYVDGVQVHSATTYGNTHEFGLNLNVSVGTRIDFAVGPNSANDWCDGFSFGVRVLQGAIADSVEDWSSSGQQGSRGWSYGYYNKGADGDATYQTGDFTAFTGGQWLNGKWDLAVDTAPWTEVTSTGGHPASSPAEHWAIRRWTSSYAGKVVLSCRLGNNNGCSGGTIGRIYKDGQLVHSRAVSGAAVGFWVPLEVSAGTILDFAIDPNGSDGCDGSSFMVRIQEAKPSLVLVADASAEWVGGSQGANNWFYGYYDRGADGDGVYNHLTDYKDSTTDANWVYDSQWHRNPAWPPWTSIGPSWGHPNGYNSSGGENWAIQRWVSKVSGPISIAWNHRKQNSGGGTTIKVFKNGQQIGATVVGGDFTGVNNIIATTVATNDVIDLALTPVAPDNSTEDWGDGTEFNTVVFGSGFDPAATSTLLADSRADWSGSGQQGYRNWYSGYYNKTADGNGTYDAGDFNMTDSNWAFDGSIWKLGPGDPPWDMLGSDWGHPNGINNGAEHWAIRRWVSPQAGTLRVDWTLAKQSTFGSGVSGHVFHNGRLADTATIAGNDTAGVKRIVTLNGVQAGDTIDIALSPIGTGGTTDDGADASYFYATIYSLNRSVDTLVADSIADWSTSGEQGYKGWTYGLYNKSSDGDGVYTAAEFVSAYPDWAFTGSAWELGYAGNIYANPPWNTVSQTTGHPNGTNNSAEVWTIRRWTSTFSGSATITWKLAMVATCGAGTSVRVFHNGTQLDFGAVAGNDTVGITRSVVVPSLAVGDSIDIALTPTGADNTGHDGCDTTAFSASIYKREAFPNYFNTDLGNWMYGSNATVYARFPFTVADPGALDMLKLRLRYDDGFVAYLNGVEVARRNAPSYQAGGLLANSLSEFSSTQGANNWFHGYYDKTADLNAVFETSDFSTAWSWNGWGYSMGAAPPWTSLDAFYSHPNGNNSGHEQWTVRRWVCESAGALRVNLRGKKQNGACGNGVTFRVFQNGTPVFSRTVEWWDTTGFATDIAIAHAEVGDLIDVALDSVGTDGTATDPCDGSEFAVTIDQEPMPALTWNSRSSAVRASGLSLVQEEIDLSAFRSLLASGNNVLAIQGLNSSSLDMDFMLQPELSGTTITLQTNQIVYFTDPTPDALNNLGTTNLGPIVDAVNTSPLQPLGTNDLIVTARATATLNPVNSLKLRYRVMYGPEQELTMFDDGAHGDGAAGDGVWGATIPVASQATAGQMVRWYIVATDTTGSTSREPSFLDPLNSPEYFGTMVQDPAVVTQLPVLYWFVQNPGAANTYGGTRCSIFYDGEFYDNVEVRIHGQSTTGFPKKSYNFDLNRGYHLRYAANTPDLEEFVLFSTYADKAHMRNVLAFDTYADAGVPAHFAFPIRVQQNGAFHSLGNFAENANSRFLERLGLNSQGALYKLYNTLNSSTSGVEKKTRRSEDNSDLQALINNLNQGDVNVRKTYMFDNLDVAEIVNYMATRAPLNSDNDWGHKNYYLYRDTGGTGEWQAMPQDVDLSFGHNWTCGSPCLAYFDDTIYTNTDFYGGYNVLFNQFKDVEPFRTMWLRRVRTLMDTVLQPPGTPLANDVYHNRIHSYAALMGPEAAMDLALWNPNWGNGLQTLAQAVARMDGTGPNNYLPGRRAFLFHTLSVDNGGPIPHAQSSGLTLAISTVDYNPASTNQDQEYIEITNPTGEAVDISGWRMAGGVQHTFKPGTVIPAGTSLYLAKDVVAFRARSVSPKGGEQRFVQGNYEGQLSARGESLALVDRAGQTNTTFSYAGSASLAQQYLRVTELMYNPVALAGNTNDPQNFEYIELKNTSAGDTLSLAGVRFTAGVEFDFTGSAVTSLAPGARVLVVKSASAFVARYGGGHSIAGEYAGSLDNAGDRITLLDAANEEILDFTYDDDWYPITDGAGFSLVVVNEAAEPDAWNWMSQWRPSGVESGSPGTGDTALPVVAAIRVNEALTHTDPPAVDTVELHNPTGSSVDIGGWFLTDNFTIPKKYRIPSPTIIPAGGYVTFDETNFNAGGLGFAFSSTGEEVYLFSGDASTNLTGYVHGFAFGAAANGVTFGRYVNSQAEEHFVAQSANTLAAANARPRVGPLVFNEIMYHPPDVGTNDNSQDEYIELLNISGASLPLYNTNHPANTWRLRGGADFDFPPGVTIPANGLLLLVNFDPDIDLLALAAFHAQYSFDPAVPVFGPYSGKLANDGETLQIQRPDLPNGTNVPYILVEAVKYADTAPWPAAADGLGQALQRVVPQDYGNDPTNWVATVPTPNNRPPTARNFSARISRNGSLVAPSERLLAAATDADGDTLTVTLPNGASTNGGVVVLTNNVLAYVPVLNFVGLDQFSYQVNDGHGGSVGVTVTVTVVGTNAGSLNIVVPPHVVGTDFHVMFAGIPGRAYRVDSATNVAGPWEPRTNITAGPNGMFELLDPVGDPPPPSRFYRTQSP